MQRPLNATTKIACNIKATSQNFKNARQQVKHIATSATHGNT